MSFISIHYYDTVDRDFFKICDSFFANLIINIKGFYQFIIKNNSIPLHFKPDIYGISKMKVLSIIDEIDTSNDLDFVNNLRNYYHKIGFLVFIDNLQNIIIYSKKDKFNKWIKENHTNLISSDDILHHPEKYF